MHNSSEKVLPHIFDAYTSSQIGTGNKKYVDNGETNDSKGDWIEKLYAFGKPSANVYVFKCTGVLKNELDQWIVQCKSMAETLV